MRIAKSFGQRTQSDRVIPRKFYLVYEGTETEVQYFDGIIDNRDYLGINSLIEIIPLLRSNCEKSYSHPKCILKSLIDFFEHGITSIIITDFIDSVIDWLHTKDYINASTLLDENDFRRILNQIFLSEGYQLSEEIDLKNACKIVNEYLSEKLSIFDAVESIREYINNPRITFEEGFDKVCLITDRDPQNFKENQYDEVLEICKNHNYSFYVSNPCFEFWLLLHFDKVFDFDKETLHKNPKKSPKAKKRFLEIKLSEIIDGYRKENIDFSKFIDHIDTAVENEKKFCEDVEQLKENLGSNIGILISELKQS